jgi:hypothetical protein
MFRQPAEPVQLVVELGPRGGVTVGHIFRGLRAPRQKRDAVPAFLPTPDRAITRGMDGGFGELLVRRLQLLKTDDMGCGLSQPLQQIGQPSVDAVNVRGRDPHRRLGDLVRQLDGTIDLAPRSLI